MSVRPEPGQHAPAGHVHFGDLHPGQMGAASPGLSSLSQREWVGSVGGGSQKPIAAKQSQAWFSGGQQLGPEKPICQQEEEEEEEEGEEKDEDEESSSSSMGGVHSSPAVYCGFSPALHIPSFAKHVQLWSEVVLTAEPGQHASHGHLAGLSPLK